MMDETAGELELELPGFRFHPTEEELLSFYLQNMVVGKRLSFDIICLLNIYHHEPWDLPGLAKIGEREWYFFVPRDRRKHGSGGGRPNRTTKHGFWKATGSDRKILASSQPKRTIGLRKTLVFYKGRAPRGSKTDWVMNEYRLPDSLSSSPKEDVVLCKIYRKATSLKVLELRAAMEEEEEGEEEEVNKPGYAIPPSSPMAMDTISSCTQHQDLASSVTPRHPFFKQENEELVIVPREKNEKTEEGFKGSTTASTTLQLTSGKQKLQELQVPKLGMDWTRDSFWTQLRSPWFDYFTPPQANLLNF